MITEKGVVLSQRLLRQAAQQSVLYNPSAHVVVLDYQLRKASPSPHAVTHSQLVAAVTCQQLN
eukprot:990947-Rhodomonas_salina.1